MGDRSRYCWDGGVEVVGSTGSVTIGVWMIAGLLVLIRGRVFSFEVFEYGFIRVSVLRRTGAKGAGLFPLEGDGGPVGSAMMTLKLGEGIECQFDGSFRSVGDKLGPKNFEFRSIFLAGRSRWSDGRCGNLWWFLPGEWEAEGPEWEGVRQIFRLPVLGWVPVVVVLA
jgi:hypothetical protein